MCAANSKGLWKERIATLKNRFPAISTHPFGFGVLLIRAPNGFGDLKGIFCRHRKNSTLTMEDHHHHHHHPYSSISFHPLPCFDICSWARNHLGKLRTSSRVSLSPRNDYRRSGSHQQWQLSLQQGTEEWLRRRLGTSLNHCSCYAFNTFLDWTSESLRLATWSQN